jgi:hypothetical protein
MHLLKSSMLVRVGGTLLMAAGVSLLSGGMAQAGGYPAQATASAAASASIIEPDGPVELSYWRDGEVKGLDSAGRTISIALKPAVVAASAGVVIAYN